MATFRCRACRSMLSSTYRARGPPFSSMSPSRDSTHSPGLVRIDVRDLAEQAADERSRLVDRSHLRSLRLVRAHEPGRHRRRICARPCRARLGRRRDGVRVVAPILGPRGPESHTEYQERSRDVHDTGRRRRCRATSCLARPCPRAVGYGLASGSVAPARGERGKGSVRTCHPPRTTPRTQRLVWVSPRDR